MKILTSLGLKKTFSLYLGTEALTKFGADGYEFDGDGRLNAYLRMDGLLCRMSKRPVEGYRRRRFSITTKGDEQFITLSMTGINAVPETVPPTTWGKCVAPVTQDATSYTISPPDAETRRPAICRGERKRSKTPPPPPFYGIVEAPDGGSFGFGLGFIQAMRLREWLKENEVEIED